MSNLRYTGGHSILHAGIFVLPVYPIIAIQFRHGDLPFRPGWLELGGLWLIGLTTSLALTALHEMAHAAIGRMVGIGISEITVGHWRKVCSWKIRQTTVVLRAAPDSGYVTLKPSLNLFSPARLAPFLAAGLLAEAAAVAVAIRVLRDDPAAPGTFGLYARDYFWWSVICFGGLHLLINLWPGQGAVGARRLPTDGRLLWQIWAGRHKNAEARLVFTECVKVDALLAARDFPAALALLESVSSRDPGNLNLARHVGVIQAAMGATDQARAHWEELLNRPGMSDAQKAEVLDNLACLSIYYDRPDLLGPAEAWLNTALRHAPGAITLKGTLGAVLVELGRPDEAAGLLREVLSGSEHPVDRAICLAYLARIAHSQGKPDEAQALLTKALALSPGQRVVKRIARALSATPGK